MEDYRSNLVLDLVGSGVHAEENVSVGGDPASWAASISEQQVCLSPSHVKLLADLALILLIQMIMRILSGDDATTEEDVQSLTSEALSFRLSHPYIPSCDWLTCLTRSSDFSPPASYYSTVPVINDRNVHRRFDAAKLREVKKRLDSPLATVADFDDVANDVMEDCVDLSSDRTSTSFHLLRLFEGAVPLLIPDGSHMSQTSATPSSRKSTRSALPN
jgi:protein JSN1